MRRHFVPYISVIRLADKQDRKRGKSSLALRLPLSTRPPTGFTASRTIDFAAYP